MTNHQPSYLSINCLVVYFSILGNGVAQRTTTRDQFIEAWNNSELKRQMHAQAFGTTTTALTTTPTMTTPTATTLAMPTPTTTTPTMTAATTATNTQQGAFMQPYYGGHQYDTLVAPVASPMHGIESLHDKITKETSNLGKPGTFVLCSAAPFSSLFLCP